MFVYFNKLVWYVIVKHYKNETCSTYAAVVLVLIKSKSQQNRYKKFQNSNRQQQ